MGVKVKSVKVRAEKYLIYNGSREPGSVFDAKPEDADKMEATGRVKKLKGKELKEEEKIEANPAQ